MAGRPGDVPCEMAHAVVIGGTGMLRGVCLGLAAQGLAVGVIARGHARLSSLARAAEGLDGDTYPLPADYSKPDELALAVRTAVAAAGAVDLIVSWTHSHSPGALPLVAGMVAGRTPPCRVVEALPCEAGAPGAVESPRFDGVEHRRVVLGWVIEPDGSRWLTDEEISAGVLRGALGNEKDSIVGVVRPWEARP